MHIRTLTASDAAPYRELMLEAYSSAPDAFTSTAEERAREPEAWWIKRIADPGGSSACFGARQGSGLLGAVALQYASKPKTRHSAQIIGMYVRAPARGKGIGKALLMAAMNHAARRPGTMILTLTVTEGNEPAVRLYQDAGFHVWGTQPMAIATPAGYKGKVHMWRTVEDLRRETAA